MVITWKIVLCLIVSILVTIKVFKGSPISVLIGFLGVFALSTIALNSLIAQF